MDYRPSRRLLHVGLALAAFGVSAGCNNGPGFTYLRGDTIAVTVGDFDNVEEPFNRVPVATVRYDGIISTATWIVDERDFTPPALNVEGLFLSERNEELRNHKLVVVASGTRGLGARQYNSLQPDDMIIGNEDAVLNARAYAQGGGVLWLTDWSYDLLPVMFPDKVDFLGDEATFDAAQRGDIGRVRASVVDEELRTALETDELALDFNYSNWAVPEAVLDPTTVRVYVQGDVNFRGESGGGTQVVNGAPLLFAVRTGEAGGLVVFSAFHLDAQNPAVIDTMLRVIVGDLDLETQIRDPGGE
jgi:hypothetical protein